MNWESDQDQVLKAYELYLKKYDDYESYLRHSKKEDIGRYLLWFVVGIVIGLYL